MSTEKWEDLKVSEPNAEKDSAKIYKIVVVGDIGTGKTSLIKRLVHDVFSPNYKATIGVDFRIYKCDAGHLQLWDIAGQERFGNMTRTYYREARAAVVTYDVNRIGTLDGATKWIQDLKEKLDEGFGTARSRIPLLIVATKSDLLRREGISVAANQLADLGKQYHAQTFLLTNVDPSLHDGSLLNGVKELRDAMTALATKVSLLRDDSTDQNVNVNPIPEPCEILEPLPKLPSQSFSIWAELVLIAVKDHWNLRKAKPTTCPWDSNLIVNLPYVNTASEDEMRKLTEIAEMAIPRSASNAIRELRSEYPLVTHKVKISRLPCEDSDPNSIKGLAWFHFY